MPASQTPAASTLLPCPKCRGAGVVIFHSIYTGLETFRGKCFECDGSKTITPAQAATSKWAKQLAGVTRYTLNTVMEAVDAGDEKRAAHYLRCVVADMFMIGTKNAREVLTYLHAGAWYYECSEEGTRRGVLPREDAKRLYRRLIALGNEHLAAQSEIAAAA